MPGLDGDGPGDLRGAQPLGLDEFRRRGSLVTLGEQFVGFTLGDRYYADSAGGLGAPRPITWRGLRFQACTGRAWRSRASTDSARSDVSDGTTFMRWAWRALASASSSLPILTSSRDSCTIMS